MARMLAEASASEREKRDPNMLSSPNGTVFLFRTPKTSGGEKSGMGIWARIHYFAVSFDLMRPGNS
jgi:hypothetical protein